MRLLSFFIHVPYTIVFLIPLFWREVGKGGSWREGGTEYRSRFDFLWFSLLFPCSGFLSQMRVCFAGFMSI